MKSEKKLNSAQISKELHIIVFHCLFLNFLQPFNDIAIHAKTFFHKNSNCFFGVVKNENSNGIVPDISKKILQFIK